MRILAIWLLYAAMLPPALAQAFSLKQVILLNENIVRLQVNSTVTTDGMVFYQSFLNFWRDKSGIEKFTIDISERPSKRRGNQILIYSGQKLIFFSALPNKHDRIRLLSEQAADACYTNLITLSLPFNESRDLDIAEDEV